MKKIILSLLCATALMSLKVQAQSPQKMSYQAVLRDASDAILSNQNVGIQISILQGSASGTPVYVEKHSLTTNQNGLASFAIGTGTVLSGNFSNINWGNGPYFIKTETDPSGSTNYTIVSSQELMSVPYALFAANAGGGGSSQWSTSGNNISNSNSGHVGIGTSSPSSKLTIMEQSANAVEILSGSNSDWAALSLGRASQEANYGISHGTNGFINGSNAGDAVIRLNDTTKKIIISPWGESTTMVVANHKVGIGTNTPSTSLDIAGNSRITGEVGIGTAPVSLNSMTIQSGDPAYGNMTIMKRVGTGTGEISWDGGNDGGVIVNHFGNATGFTSFVGNGNNLMQLNNNGNIGIGTGSPTAKLHVAGTLKVVDGTQGAGKVLTSDATGTATWQTPAAVSETDPQVSSATTNKVPKWNGTTLTDGIITDNGTKVGIGTTSPSSKLTIMEQSANAVELLSGSNTDWAALSLGRLTQEANYGISHGNDGFINGSNAGDAVIRLNDTTKKIIISPWGNSTTMVVANHKVGIGTNTPSTSLDIAGNVKITDGTQGAGKVLTSDATGTATWQTPAAAVETDPQVSSVSTNKVPKWNGTTLTDGIITDNGTNVGIGTSSPSSKLTIMEQSANAVEILSGSNSDWAALSLGRASQEANYGISHGTNGFINGSNAGDAVIRLNDTTKKIIISPWGESTTMVVANHKVGIGTNTPSTSLDIAGNSRITGELGIGTAPVSLNSMTIQSGDPAYGNMTIMKRVGTGTGEISWDGGNDGGVIVNHFGNATGFTSFFGNGNNLMQLNNNGNIGIGTGSPTAKLHVAGTLKVVDGTQGAGKVLTSDATGTATWQTPAATVETDPQVSSTTTNKVPKWNGTTLTDGIITDNGTKVGIGTTSPSSKLTIMEQSANAVEILSGSNTDWAALSLGRVSQEANYGISHGNDGFINGSNAGDAVIRLNDTTKKIIISPWGNSTTMVVANHKVGIGTNTPSTSLDIAGNVKITDGTQGAGKVLTSDATGTATWQTPAAAAETDPQVSSATTNKVPKWNGTTLTDGIITDNGTKVGIGTTSPTSKLTIMEQSANAVELLSGSTTDWAALSLGRLTQEANYGISHGTNGFINGSNAGDAVIRLNDTTKKIIISPWANSTTMVVANHKVGIGTNSPSANLDIAGNVKITDGTQGAGKVLTSDANGLASWQRTGALAYGVVSSTGTLGNNYGIASVTRNSVGNYTVTLSTTPSTTATVNATMSDVSGWGFVSAHYVSGNTITVICRNASSTLQDSNFNIVVYAP